jgi:hypothetical protein
MGCGCKNKTNSQTQTSQTTVKESTANSVKAAIQKTVEKYYEKK